MRIITTFFLIILVSCQQTGLRKGKHLLDFGSFTIEAPYTWKQVKEQIPFDSYVGRIITGNKDTLFFDLGKHSNDLTEYVKMKEGDSTTFYLNQNNQIIRGDSIKIDSFVKSIVMWDTIDHRKAKIVSPKKSGTGVTGVFIDSLWKLGTDNSKFNLYGIDLTLKTENELLEAIKTIKFVN